MHPLQLIKCCTSKSSDKWQQNSALKPVPKTHGGHEGARNFSEVAIEIANFVEHSGRKFGGVVGEQSWSTVITPTEEVCPATWCQSVYAAPNIDALIPPLYSKGSRQGILLRISLLIWPFWVRPGRNQTSAKPRQRLTKG